MNLVIYPVLKNIVDLDQLGSLKAANHDTVYYYMLITGVLHVIRENLGRGLVHKISSVSL